MCGAMWLSRGCTLAPAVACATAVVTCSPSCERPCASAALKPQPLQVLLRACDKAPQPSHRSRRPDGGEDVASIHAAEVVRGGDKWIATRWMRQAE
jgi:hypothetical protein